MKLSDQQTGRSVELRPVARTAEGGVELEVVAGDDEHRWTRTTHGLSAGEIDDLAAWLTGLSTDLTAGPGEWTSITFEDTVLSASGQRVPGGTVELRIAVLGMHAAGDATTDVVVGLRTTAEHVTGAARELVRELSDLRPADPRPADPRPAD